MRPTYWTSRFLKVIGAARNSVSRAGQSNPSPMNELVPTISKGSASAVWLASCSEISRRWRAFIWPLSTTTDLPALRSRSAICVEVVDPRGEYEDVGAVGVSGEDVGDDLRRAELHRRSVLGRSRPFRLARSDRPAGCSWQPGGMQVPAQRRHRRVQHGASRHAGTGSPHRSSTSASCRPMPTAKDTPRCR